MTSFVTWSHQVQFQAQAKPRARRFMGIVILGLVLMLGVLYLFETNAVATKGYEIKDLQSNLKTLKQEGGKLEVEASKLQSLGDTAPTASSTSFVAVKSIEYLAAAVPQGGVAVK